MSLPTFFFSFFAVKSVECAIEARGNFIKVSIKFIMNLYLFNHIPKLKLIKLN